MSLQVLTPIYERGRRMILPRAKLEMVEETLIG